MIQRFTIFDFMSLRIIELFGGIGACTAAIKQLNIPYEIVDYVEIDKYAVASYNAINNTRFEPQDITKWDKDFKDIDLIMHGSPCQDFSLAGKGAGGDEGSGTRSSLLYESIRIISKIKPKYVVWENVKNVLSKKHKHNFENYLKKMEELGYKNYYQVLNAKDYGIPQNRERVFTISILNNSDFQFPKKQELNLRLKDMLEDEVDEKYYISDGQFNNILSENQAGYLSGGKWDKINESCRRYYKEDGISPTIHTCQGGNTEPKILIKNATKKGYLEAEDGDGVYISNIDKKRGTVQKGMIPTLKTSPDIGVVLGNYSPSGHNASRIVNSKGVAPTVMENQQGNIIYDELRVRKLTPKECWRLMGFKDEDFEKAAKVCSNTQLYKQAGNSIVVNVLVEIFKELLKEKIK